MPIYLGAEICVDTDDGATGGDILGCRQYTPGGSNPLNVCGKYDDSDFVSNKLCCACGGGKKLIAGIRPFI